MSRTPQNSVSDGPFSPLHRPKMLARWLANGRFVLTSYGLEKRCTRCKCYWPADTEFFFADSSAGDRLFTWCVACVLENKVERRQRAAINQAEARP